MVHDKTALEEAKDWGEKYRAVRSLRFKMADELAEFMGPDAVADSMKIPLWKAGVHAERERSACRQHRAGKGSRRKGKCFCTILRIVQGHFSLDLTIHLREKMRS
jgi:hypothetical protein